NILTILRLTYTMNQLKTTLQRWINGFFHILTCHSFDHSVKVKRTGLTRPPVRLSDTRLLRCLILTVCFFPVVQVTAQTIQELINGASNGSTVELSAGTHNISSALQIPVGKNITIRGAGMSATIINQ